MSGQLKIISHSVPSSGESGEVVPMSAILRAEGGDVVRPTFLLGYNGPGSYWSVGLPALELYGMILPTGAFVLEWPDTLPSGNTLDLTNYFYVNLPLPLEGQSSANLNWYLESGSTSPNYMRHQRIDFQILANWPHPYPVYTIKCESTPSPVVNSVVLRKLVVECNVISPRHIDVVNYLVRKSDGAILRSVTGGSFNMIGTNRKEINNDFPTRGDVPGMTDGEYYVCSEVHMA